jgi:hypothetical protein
MKLIVTQKAHLKKYSFCMLAAGLPVPVVWTWLAQTAKAGDRTLIVQEAVTWKEGDNIVIASTGHRYGVFQE